MPRYYLPNGKSVWNEQDVPDDKMEEFIALHMKDEEESASESNEIEQFIKTDVPPTPEKGIISKGWDAISKPLTDWPSRAARSVSENVFQPLRKNIENERFASYVGGLEGAVEGLGDVASGFTSPINIATLGLGTRFKGLHNIGKLASGLMTGHGIGEVASPDSTWQERAWGVAETAGGILGMKAKLGKIGDTVKSSEPVPPIDLAPTPAPPTRFPEGALKRRFDQLIDKEQSRDLTGKDLAEARQLSKLLRNADVEPINPDTGEYLNPRPTQTIKTASGETTISGATPEQIAKAYGPIVPETSGKMMKEVPDNPEMAGYDPYRRTTGKGPVEIPIEEPPTATFAGMQDDGAGGEIPLFTVKGGIKDKSTVSAQGLTELGIEVPPTALTPEVLPAKNAAITPELMSIEKSRSQRIDDGEKVSDPMDVAENGNIWVNNLYGKGMGGYADSVTLAFIEDTQRMKTKAADRAVDPIQIAKDKAVMDAWNNPGKALTPEPLPIQAPKEIAPNQFAKLTPEEQALVVNELNKPVEAAPGRSTGLTPEEQAIANASHVTEAAGQPRVTDAPRNIINDGTDIIDQTTGEVLNMDRTPPISEVPPPEMMAAAPPPIKPPGPPPNVLTAPLPPNKGPRKPRGPRIVPEIVMNPDGTFSPKGTPVKFDKSGNQVAGPAVTPENLSWLKETMAFPRAVMASIDLPPFRQGLPAITNTAWWTSWDDMLKAYGSESAFKVVQDGITNDPMFDLAQTAGVKFTDTISKAEEAFSSKAAGYVPGVTRSHRAHIAFLNKLRMDSFRGLINDQMKAAKQPGLAPDPSLDPNMNEVLLKQFGEFVNDMTGRGSLNTKTRFTGTRAEIPGIKAEKYADLLNNILFSPRLIASRVRMFNRYLNPHTYAMMPPAIRKETIKSLVGVAGTWSITAGLLSQIPGAEVSMDPTNSDFGKIKIGNLRMDPGGGFQQYLVAQARLISGHSTSSTTGKTTELGQSFTAPTRGDIVGNFMTNKLNPPVKFAYDLLTANKNQPFNVLDKSAKMVMPIIIQDLIELYKEDPKLLPLLGLMGVGMGGQIYGDNDAGKIVSKSWDYQIEGGSMFR